MADINFRKKKLKDDIDLLETGFKNRVEKVQSYIPITLNPNEAIRKHPFRAMGVAIASGLLIGLSSRKKRSRSDHQGSHSDSNSDNGFSSLLMYELKRLAASRAVSYISDFIDQRADQKN